MKLNLLQQDFLPVLQAVSRSVGVKASLPVLGNILFSTEDNKLKVAATNLEIGVIKYLECEIIEPGEITIPARTITEIVSGLNSTKIELEVSADVVTIKAGKFKANINGLAASE